MPREPQVLVKDKETGHEYLVSEARYKRTPELWERLGPEPPKPRTTVTEAAGRKAQRLAQNPEAEGLELGPNSGHEADPTKEED